MNTRWYELGWPILVGLFGRCKPIKGFVSCEDLVHDLFGNGQPVEFGKDWDDNIKLFRSRGQSGGAILTNLESIKLIVWKAI